MRITPRLLAVLSVVALIGSATPAWAGGSAPAPGGASPSGSASSPGVPGSGAPSPSVPPTASASTATTSGSPTVSGAPSGSTTPSSASVTPKVAAQAAYPVTGAIGVKWQSVKGTVGEPTGAMQRAGGGYWQRFEHGVITYIGGAGAHALTGAVEAKWSAQTDAVRFTWLGFPIADGGDDVTFQKGRIIRNPGRDATYMIGGSIYRTFVGAGAVPVMGLPISDEANGRGGGVKRISRFEKGAVTWDSAGTYAVVGRIYSTWSAAGAELSSYGAPRSNQIKNGGVYDQRFANRNSVLTYVNGQVIPETGAVGAEYIRRGMSKSDLKYPLAPMRAVSGGYQQNFYNGNIKYAGGIKIIVNTRMTSHTTTASETRYTYRSGCPVAPSALTTTEMNFYGYNGKVQRGVIITRSGVTTTRVQQSFTAAAQAAWPIKMMYNPDHFKGDDPTMLAYGNTSAFNCRKVTGSPYSTSPHSYGTAIDINDFENPYQDSNGKWWPVDNGSNGAAYWRTHRSAYAGKGVLTGSDVMTKALTSRGAFWGARWSNPDYQHFQWN
ncbi:M15 family metallopeptidase [Acidipropionibacterium virtanenii]|uniref:Peptidase M15C domain-containing protein n=1 Tax=Acidipropionibacterium virtanenii TaxID=2057246 RepID=A0A344UQU3_9ACTN|nr:M15 family metallopeptidase [Acidipropionibacterium virtanenii]AXE37641.1 hypothetical protein JS278_00448 [Acidipropionibacterium virtanenii]